MLVLGCSLSESGTATSAGDSAVDASAPADSGSSLPCATDANACTAALVGGWAAVAFSTSRAVACPARFQTAEVVGDAVAEANACACDCVVTKPPSCGVGMLGGQFGNSSSCTDGTNGPYNVPTDGACVSWGGTFALVPYHNWNALPLTAGTCTSTATGNATKVTHTDMRACVPAAECAEDVCTGAVPAGFASCIMHASDVACPAGPFTQKVVVGGDVQLGCGACSACSATGSGCGPATLEYHGDPSCSSLKATDNVNGSCNADGNGATNVTHIKYSSAVQGAVCAFGTSVAAVDLTMKQTICCRP